MADAPTLQEAAPPRRAAPSGRMAPLLHAPPQRRALRGQGGGRGGERGGDGRGDGRDGGGDEARDGRDGGERVPASGDEARDGRGGERGGGDNRRRTLTTFLIASALLVAVVIVGRLLAVGEPGIALTTNFTAKNLAPSFDHLFGTDWMGRDMFARTLAGLSTSVLVGLLAAGASALLALGLGTVAALGGRRADAVITWLIDLMLGIPHIVLLILISFALGKGFWGVAIGVAVTHWPHLARVIRAEILQCRESVFVAQARKLGAGSLAIVRNHLFPHVFPQFLVGLVLLFPHAILHEASITFLGFGLPPEQPAIGIILSESMSYLSAGYWWLALFPGIALVATVLLFDRAGSNLRRIIDPRRSQE